jgi:hypothetical protein
MSEFIVLGLIPGTQIQITFFLWLAVVLPLIVFVCAHLIGRTHRFRSAIITLYLLVLSRKTPDTEDLWATL